MLQQLDQHTARLILKLELDSFFAELKALHVELEYAEASKRHHSAKTLSLPARVNRRDFSTVSLPIDASDSAVTNGRPRQEVDLRTHCQFFSGSFLVLVRRGLQE